MHVAIVSSKLGFPLRSVGFGVWITNVFIADLSVVATGAERGQAFLRIPGDPPGGDDGKHYAFKPGRATVRYQQRALYGHVNYSLFPSSVIRRRSFDEELYSRPTA
jgi:hypothetical protein